MAKLKRKLDKYTYIQDMGTYSNQVIVTAGTTDKELLKWMRKANIKKDMIDNFENGLDEHWNDIAGCQGKVWHDEGKSILWLKEWSNDWEAHDTLMHEVLHIVQFVLMEGKGMGEEWEAQAYMQEYLVKNIRQKLFKEMYV